MMMSALTLITLGGGLA